MESVRDADVAERAECGGDSVEVQVFSSAPVTSPIFLARLLGAGVLLAGFIGAVAVAQQPAAVAIDYPAEGSIFPPDMAAPTFLWRDVSEGAVAWSIEVAFSDGSAGITLRTRGERVRLGEIDARAIAPTNVLPTLTPQEAAAQSWKPDAETWAAIKKHSVERPATVTISGFGERLAPGRLPRPGGHPDLERSGGRADLLP